MDDVQPWAARFDSTLGAWILSCHADVSAALREPRLSIAGADPGAQSAHVAVRNAAAHALSSERLTVWRKEMTSLADTLAAGLPADRPVDLVTDFAKPWSCALAIAVTGASAADAARLTLLAREVFLAAACATESELPPHALAAAVELASGFRAGPDGSADVQTFVALSQTLPCLLAGAWLELFRRRADISRLRASDGLLPRAVEELLRLAGPSRAVFRRALDDIVVGSANISAGEHVVLMLSAANRDPARFPEPDRMDLGRAPATHLAFGHGMHSCAGAALIRMAVAVATNALLGTSSDVEPVGDIEWIGGFAIRGPGSLRVVLRQHHDAEDEPKF